MEPVRLLLLPQGAIYGLRAAAVPAGSESAEARIGPVARGQSLRRRLRRGRPNVVRNLSVPAAGTSTAAASGVFQLLSQLDAQYRASLPPPGASSTAPPG